MKPCLTVMALEKFAFAAGGLLAIGAGTRTIPGTLFWTEWAV